MPRSIAEDLAHADFVEAFLSLAEVKMADLGFPEWNREVDLMDLDDRTGKALSLVKGQLRSEVIEILSGIEAPSS